MNTRFKALTAIFLISMGSPVVAKWAGLSDDGPLQISLEEAPRLFQQCSRGAPRPVGNLWLPSQSEVAALESRLESYFTEHDRQLDWLMGRHSRKYRGQFVGFERAGVEYIYAAYLSDDIRLSGSTDGKAVILCDGGSSAWGIVYNPSTGELSEFFGNGN